MTVRDEWERVARRWAAWARKEHHDSYWTHSRDPFLTLVPPPGRATIDIGCGEGRVARDLKERGHKVTGVDASPTLIQCAKEADPDGAYVHADAAALPFADNEFDLAIAFNSLMDMDDLHAVVLEAARVLEPGAPFCVCVVHPIAYAGHFEAPERFVVDRHYLKPSILAEEFSRDGLTMSFTSWTRPLESYSHAFEHAGFVIEAIREPPDPVGKWTRVPNFLMLRLIKL